MQNRIFFICIHLIVIVSFGQTKVLSNYKFEKGEYYLVGQRSESDYNSFADSLGNFYTDDIGLLNSIKKEWIFKKPSPKWSCGYHYTIHIVKNGKDLETFNINLNCNVIVCGDDYFYFESEKLEKFKENLKNSMPNVKRLQKLVMQELIIKR